MHQNKSLQPKITFQEKTILILFGIFLFFFLLEIGLRLSGFILSSSQEHRNRISIKQKGAYRIMCLGESTTALGGKDSYPSQLEEILNARKMRVKFSVINKGAIGTNTTSILNKLEENLNRYRPDIVITMMGINDYGQHVPYQEITASRITLFLRSFTIYKLTRLLWLHIVAKAKVMGFYKARADNEFNESGLTLFDIRSKEYYTEQINSIRTEGLSKKAIELTPRDDKAYNALGWCYINEGKLIEAEEPFKKAVELNPRNVQARVGLGWCYVTQEKLTEAEETLKKAIELNPRNDKAYTGLGWCYLTQGEFTQPEELFKKAVELNTQNVEAYLGLGCCYRKQGKLIEAEEPFKKAVELNPRNVQARVGLGWCYVDQKKFAQAEEALKKSIELNPRNDKAYGALAVLYQEMKRYELADEYYKKTNQLRLEYCNPRERYNYQRLKEILDRKGIKLICVQYPMRSIEPLKNIFQEQKGIIFVDNEKIFKEAVRKDGYKEYFTDIFASDFGHCTRKGNRILAENVANTILKEYFKR